MKVSRTVDREPCMIGTLVNTTRVLRAAWRLLSSDRDLLLFPVMMSAALFFVLLYVLVAFQYGGTFSRITGSLDVHIADFVLLGIGYFGAAFVLAYFNASLVAAANYRLMGGTPDLRFGIEAANDRLGALALWALVGSTVALIVSRVAGLGGVLGRAATSFAEVLGLWAPFLVAPVMVIESSTPFEAMRRSTEMFRETWGRTLVPNFGFGLVYTGLALLAIGVGAGSYAMTGSMGFSVIAALFSLTVAATTVRCLETLFTVALYNYATTGETDGVFPEEYLRDSFVYKNDKGKFGPPSMPRRVTAQ